jgi:hypothetical protein
MSQRSANSGVAAKTNEEEKLEQLPDKSIEISNFALSPPSHLWNSHRMRKTSSSRNTRWSDEEDKRLIALLANGGSWESIASELKRSYVAVEARALKLKKLASLASALPGRRAAIICQPKSSRAQSLNLSRNTISETAVPLVADLYDQAMAYRAATIAKSYRYQKLKPRLQSVIAAIIQGLLAAQTRGTGADWSSISISRTRASENGINEEILQNLLEGLTQYGFIERFTGYPGMPLTSHAARRGRRTRIRGTLKLFDLCARFQVTSENILA